MIQASLASCLALRQAGACLSGELSRFDSFDNIMLSGLNLLRIAAACMLSERLCLSFRLDGAGACDVNKLKQISI